MVEISGMLLIVAFITVPTEPVQQANQPGLVVMLEVESKETQWGGNNHGGRSRDAGSLFFIWWYSIINQGTSRISIQKRK